MASWALHIYCVPYKRAAENSLASLALGSISLTLLLGALIRGTKAEVAASMSAVAVDAATMGTTLVVIAVFAYAAVLVLVVHRRQQQQGGDGGGDLHMHTQSKAGVPFAHEATAFVNPAYTATGAAAEGYLLTAILHASHAPRCVHLFFQPCNTLRHGTSVGQLVTRRRKTHMWEWRLLFVETLRI